MVAGELTTRSSISLMVDCSNLSSRGLLEADVAIANAAAAVDVLLLVVVNFTGIHTNGTNIEHDGIENRKSDCIKLILAFLRHHLSLCIFFYIKYMFNEMDKIV